MKPCRRGGGIPHGSAGVLTCPNLLPLLERRCGSIVELDGDVGESVVPPACKVEKQYTSCTQLMVSLKNIYHMRINVSSDGIGCAYAVWIRVRAEGDEPVVCRTTICLAGFEQVLAHKIHGSVVKPSCIPSLSCT